MVLTVQYRGKPMTLDVVERVEEIDTTSFVGSGAIVGIRHLVGRILGVLPEGVQPGDVLRLRSRGLHVLFRLVPRDGVIRSDGVYQLPKDVSFAA